MFGGSNSNHNFLSNQEKTYQFDSNGPLQLQLFRNENANCNMDSGNFSGFNQPNPSKPVSVPVTNTDNLFGLSLNNNLNLDWVSCGLGLGLQNTNPIRVSTGLRLACDQDDYNSYASSITAGTSREMFNIFDDLSPEISRLDQELDRLIRLQEKELYRGYLDIKQRHTVSLVNSINRKFEQKLHEKDLELEAINAKNRDLIEKLQQAALEAQQWQSHAWQSELLVNSLKAQLQQAVDFMGQPVEQFAENDAESSCVVGCVAGQTGQLRKCRKCGQNEAVMLLIPCRHLALCEWCEKIESNCPVCLSGKSHSVPVNFA